MFVCFSLEAVRQVTHQNGAIGTPSRSDPSSTCRSKRPTEDADDDDDDDDDRNDDGKDDNLSSFNSFVAGNFSFIALSDQPEGTPRQPPVGGFLLFSIVMLCVATIAAGVKSEGEWPVH